MFWALKNLKPSKNGSQGFVLPLSFWQASALEWYKCCQQSRRSMFSKTMKTVSKVEDMEIFGLTTNTQQHLLSPALL